jgi:hypothetical protein
MVEDTKFSDVNKFDYLQICLKALPSWSKDCDLSEREASFLASMQPSTTTAYHIRHQSSNIHHKTPAWQIQSKLSQSNL